MFEKELTLASRFILDEIYEKDGIEFLVVKRTPCYITFRIETEDGPHELRKKICRDAEMNEEVAWYVDCDTNKNELAQGRISSVRWILNARENFKKS